MKYFVDTNVQIERTFRTKARRERAESILHGATVVTSSYVYKEYLATMIYSCVMLYNAVRVSEDVWVAIEKLQTHWPSKFKRYVSVFTRLAQEYGTNNREDFLDKLDQLIRYQAEDMFWAGVSERLNSTDCEIARRIPEKREDNSWFLNRGCRKANPPPACDMCKFFAAWNHQYQAIVDLLDHKNDPEMRTLIATARRCLANSDVPLGSNCHDMSDAVVIIEAPGDAVILTTNGKHFEPLCDLLGKNLKVIEYRDLV